MRLTRTVRQVLTAGLLLLIVGCASQETFRQGQTLLEAGNPEEGIVQLRKAMDEQPGNLEYRAYYYRQREVWVNKLLREAENARINQRWDEAEARYKRVLDVDEVNARAQDGLKEAEVGRRREQDIQTAEAMFNKDELESARDKVRRVLAENPSNSPARALLSRIEQKRAATSTPTARLAAKFRKPVSLEFKEAPIKTVFEMLSKAAGVNFILDHDLRPDQKVSVFVKHTNIEAALQNILSTGQLGKKVLDENSLLIFPISKKNDYEEMVARTFYLSSVEPKQAMNLIKTVVKTKDIFVDDKLNILVMRDTMEAVRLAEKLIASYDLGDPEVLLEVEVLEVSRSKLLDLGVRYPNQISVGVKGTPGAGQLNFNDLKHFTSGMGIVTINDPAFVLNLQATDGSSNLLANPRIRVKNHKKAKVHIGDRVPVITTTSTATGFSSESVNYLDVGLKLDVEPSITVTDEVSIDIGLEVSNIVNEITSKNGTLTYRIGTRNANTTLRLKNGETQMLAGLINDEERSTNNRVPGISSLPIIGRLFASKKDTHDKTEIVLLITPRIVRNIMPPDASDVEFSTGTESGNTRPGSTAEFGGTPGYMPVMPAPPQPAMMQPASLEGLPMNTSPVNGLPATPAETSAPVAPPPPLPSMPIPMSPAAP